MNWIKNNWGWVTTIIVGILPLIGIMDIFNIDFSGNKPWISISTITVPAHRTGDMPREVSGAHMAVKITGEWAIRWLVIVLSLTPFSIVTGKKPSLYVRQAAGIAAFTYAFLHFLFFCIDRGIMETFDEIGFILGLIATLIMLVLTVTSNKRSMKFLRKAWKKIHRFAYFAALLAIMHVVLLDHGDWVPYAVILVVGFLLRLAFIRQTISKLKTQKTQGSAFSVET